ncbi:MAG: hypothetical protein KKH93_01425, partial [Candidatus Omnitrophica bacterium]|nr:hypothetical protein [Candidatus Omnitrophota bacterium]
AGWDGPYLENNIGAHPWGGSYYIASNGDWGSAADPRVTAANGMNELAVEIENCRYPCESSDDNSKAPVPLVIAEKIDKMLDDGNLSSGFIQGPGSSNDRHWVLFWDICTPAAFEHCY